MKIEEAFEIFNARYQKDLMLVIFSKKSGDVLCQVFHVQNVLNWDSSLELDTRNSLFYIRFNNSKRHKKVKEKFIPQLSKYNFTRLKFNKNIGEEYILQLKMDYSGFSLLNTLFFELFGSDIEYYCEVNLY